MFGDLILWIREKWKQFWCIHEYEYKFVTRVHCYEQCKKCGKVKEDPLIEEYGIMCIFIILFVAAFATLFLRLIGII